MNNMKKNSKLSSIRFDKITVEGFGSIVKPTSFQLERGGLFLVNGSNGAGKTTIFSALLWGMYGKTLKSNTVDQIPSRPDHRDDTWKGTRVEVYLSKGDDTYMIARHINYVANTKGRKGASKLLLFKNNELVDGQYNKDIQAILQEEIFGVDVNAFTNSIIFGQRAKRLIEADNSEKRKLFEQFFDVQWVDDFQDNLTIKLGQIGGKLVDIEYEIKLKNNSIEDTENNLLEAKKAKELFIENKNNKLKKLSEKIQEQQKLLLSTTIHTDTYKQVINIAEEEITNNTSQLKSVVTELFEAEVSILDSMIVEDIEVTQNNIKETENKLNNLTKKILIDLPQAPDKSIIQKEINEINNEIKEIIQKRKNTADSFIKTKKEINRSKSLIDEYNENKTQERLCKFCVKDFPSSYLDPILKVWDTKIKRENETIEVLNTDLVKYQKLLDVDTDSVIDKLTKTKEAKEKELEQVDKKIQEIDGIKDAQRTLKYDIKVLEDILNKHKKELKDFNLEKTKVGELKQPKDNYVPYTYLEKSENQLDDEKVKYFTSLTNNLSKLNRTVEENTKLLTKADYDLKYINENIQKIEEDIIETKKEKFYGANISDIETKLKTLVDGVKELNTELTKVTKEQEHLTWWKKAATGAGIKSYLFQNLINYLNQKVAKYAQKLGVLVEFGIDYSKASTPFYTYVYKDGVETDYTTLSGGEKQQIDIVLAFATHDLSMLKVDTNILVMDEVFEGLDKNNIEIVFELIRLKAQNKTVFIITHSDTIDTKDSKSILVTKENKTTTIHE